MASVLVPPSTKTSWPSATIDRDGAAPGQIGKGWRHRQGAAVHALQRAPRRQLAKVAADGVLGDVQALGEFPCQHATRELQFVQDGQVALRGQHLWDCTVLRYFA
jgi:hypothetical protein